MNSEFVLHARRRVAVYFSFIRLAFLNMLAYRLRYYTGILTYLFMASVHYFLWQAIFKAKSPDATVNGFQLREIITYISIGWISRSFYFSNIDNAIDDMVETGQIATYLLRPVHFQLMMLSQAVGESAFRILFFSVPIGLALIYCFSILPPASWIHALLFCEATVVGFLVLAQVNFIIGLMSFYLKSIDGMMRAKYYIVQLCSGLLLPLSFFPHWAQTLLHALPFQTIAHVPLQFYLGKVSLAESGPIFMNQLFWIFALWLTGRLLWGRALAKLTLQGG